MVQQLSEKYRPSSFGEVVGQSGAVKRLQTVSKRGIGGRAYWLSGASGVGKTTLARILAAEIADDLNVLEYDSADKVNTEELRRIDDHFRLYGMGAKNGRAVIINEAHGLRKPIIRILLGMLERLSPTCLLVFTTTKDGEAGLFEDQIDASPLLSRCIHVKLTSQGLAKPFAERVRQIATAEGLNGQPPARYVALARKHHNNMRGMLMAVESGEMED